MTDPLGVPQAPIRHATAPPTGRAAKPAVAAARRRHLAQAFQRRPPDEVGGLAARHREPEAGRERVVEWAHVVAPRAEATLEPGGLEGERAGVADPEIGPRANDLLVEVGDELGRDQQLPAELAGE